MDFLKSRGATVVEITIPHLQWMSLAHGIKISSEFAMEWDSYYSSLKMDMEANTKITVGLGNSLTALETLSADKVRAWGVKYVRNIFKKERLTAIVNPTVGVQAPPLTAEAMSYGESNTALVVQVMKYIFMANYLGLPGYTVPVGYVASESGSDLPVGFHMMGNHWQEHHLLRLAHAFDTGLDIDKRFKAPQYFYDPLQGEFE